MTDRPRVSRYVEQLMGMPISLALRGRHRDDTLAADAWAAVLADLREVDRVFSTYRSDSCVSRLGRGEITLTDCPPEVAEVLALGEQARRESSGAFDVRHHRVGGRDLVLDPSGVVKGWAVERASRWLHALPDTDFCLAAGGDLVCRADPGHAPWRIGIENPSDPGRLVDVVPLRRGGLATSGTAHRGQHLVDARTGVAPSRVAQVTVVAESLTWADIDATAAYALDAEAATWLRGRRGRTGLVVWRDGTIERCGPAPRPTSG